MPTKTIYTPLALRVCQLYWYGEEPKAIASRLNLTEARVKALLALPETQTIIEQLTDKTLDTMLDVATQAQAAAPSCLEEKISLALHSSDEKVRTTNCKDILEMAGHSPVKRISLNRPDANSERHEGLSEAELRDALKKRVGYTSPGDLDPGRVLN